MHRRVVVSLACLALAVGSSARADTAVKPSTAEPADLEVGVVLGAFTPIGGYGIEAQLGFAPWFALGIGVGDEPWGSPQAGIMPRARIPFGSHIVYAGVGGSWGHFRSPEWRFCVFGPCGPRDADGQAEYVTGEVGFEEHTDHLFARGFLGGKTITNYDELCPSERCDRYFLYGGVTAGVRI
jgi:hypothetical protein